MNYLFFAVLDYLKLKNLVLPSWYSYRFSVKYTLDKLRGHIITSVRVFCLILIYFAFNYGVQEFP